MKNRYAKIVKSTIVSIIIICSFVNYQPDQMKSLSPFFTLTFVTGGGGVRPDYGGMIHLDLSEIGINVDVIVQDWPTFVSTLLYTHNFDMVYIGLSGGGLDPDFSGIYDENGSLNMFGYDTSMDWDEELGTGINEWYIQEGKNIMPPNSVERI